MEVVCFTPQSLYSRVPFWIGSWMGLRTGLRVVEKRKISCPCWE
jgi:hypothetical protein